jgi:two-component system chemotaxis response regulator CheY
MGMKVLVVDDSGFMRKRIVEILRSAGHSVIGEAKSGDEAVELYGKLSPDLVTMDITMREMDGITAAKQILGTDPHANIVFLTILKDDKFRLEAEKIGAKGFVNKTDAALITGLINELENKRHT